MRVDSVLHVGHYRAGVAPLDFSELPVCFGDHPATRLGGAATFQAVEGEMSGGVVVAGFFAHLHHRPVSPSDQSRCEY